MIHDQGLLRRLTAFPTQRFDGLVYRVTSLTRDPLVASAYGGRWGIPQNATSGTSVLYTSMDRDGALAEVASYLVDLSPLPRSNLMKVHAISLTASRVVRLTMSDIESLGCNRTDYGTRDYLATQKVGAALEHLGIDGLLAPSARYQCENLMLFTTQHKLDEKLEVQSSEEVEWRDWARQRGMLDGKE